MTAFAPSRADGRSDRQVIVELVTGAQPGDSFDFPALIDALAEGLDKQPQRGRVYRAIAAANRTLLREDSRYLGVVRGVGYRMLRADEHLPEAVIKKDRAEAYIGRGLALLRHTRLDELNDNERNLHQGQLMVLAGLNSAMRTQQARQDRQDSVIADLRTRVERIESEQP